MAVGVAVFVAVAVAVAVVTVAVSVMPVAVDLSSPMAVGVPVGFSAWRWKLMWQSRLAWRSELMWRSGEGVEEGVATPTPLSFTKIHCFYSMRICGR